jgi:hypothetical protein
MGRLLTNHTGAPHRVLLAATACDSPAEKNISRWIGHNSRCACEKCHHHGVLRGSIYSHGLASDETLRPRTHEEFLHLQRQQAAAPNPAAEQRLASQFGLKPGETVLSRLPYFNLVRERFIVSFTVKLIPPGFYVHC